MASKGLNLFPPCPSLSPLYPTIGKTHTMLGTAGSPGVIFHTMMDLYRCIGRMKDEKSFEVAVSYCEVRFTCHF